MVGFDHSHEFKSSEEARAHIAKEAPALLNYISDKELESFAKRPCSHIGRAVKCSKLHAGRVALVGDAGNAYPPIGQGINHAMESASVLDKCIADTEEAGKDIAEALALYTKVWLPEAHAINWIAQRVEFGNTWKAILNTVSFLLGISVVQDAKRNDKTWSELAQAAQRRQAALKVAGCSILSLAVAGAAMSIARWR